MVSKFWKDSTRPSLELGDNSGILGKQDVRQLDFVPQTPKRSRNPSQWGYVFDDIRQNERGLAERVWF